MEALHTVDKYLSLAAQSENQAAKAKLISEKNFYLRQADRFRFLAGVRRRKDTKAADLKKTQTG